jgi:hypothetical protein
MERILAINAKALTTIKTTIQPPTNNRPRRVKAEALNDAPNRKDFILYLPYSGGEAVDEHTAAARALMDRLGWNYDVAIGAARDGYYFVQVPHSCYPVGGVA